MNKDIETKKDVQLLVDTFYDNARKDPKIGHIFEEHLSGHWEEHLEKLYRFWQTVILKDMSYYGKPVEPHFTLHLSEGDFKQWLQVWIKTVDDLFAGPKAEWAKLRGRTMSEAFYKKLSKHK